MNSSVKLIYLEALKNKMLIKIELSNNNAFNIACSSGSYTKRVHYSRGQRYYEKQMKAEWTTLGILMPNDERK